MSPCTVTLQPMTRRLNELAEARLAELAEVGRLRQLRPYRREGTDVVRADGTRLIDFSGNDYLGLSRNPGLIARAREWTERYGAGASASRLVTGTLDAYMAVEEKLAAAPPSRRRTPRRSAGRGRR